MKYLPVTMLHNDISQCPVFPLPSGYTLRNFSDGKQSDWATIETAAGEFDTVEVALERFNNEFGQHIKQFSERSLFLLNTKGTFIGTGTAWYTDDFEGEEYGRVHWIGIHPDYQGKKLAKPLCSAIIDILKHYHAKAFLTTQTTSYKAVKIYLDFGFKPLVKTNRDKKAWELLAKTLPMKSILNF